ncbi:MAG: hypothetical protein ACT4NP_08005 [Pseudonocardiales bacterium]
MTRFSLARRPQFGVGGVLAALDSVLWVNNPARVAFAEYKPVQLRVASGVGLQVPRTLVTNDHCTAREFAAEVGGKIVCKTLSSLVLREGGNPRITYTTPIDLATVDPVSLAGTAHLLQEWVPKRYDARVTMVGHRPFAVAIHAHNDATRIDWRADYNALTYAPLNQCNPSGQWLWLQELAGLPIAAALAELLAKGPDQ